MTISNTIRYGYYAVAEVGPYTYSYPILSAAEFEVRIDGALTTAYSLTGVGNPDGGTFTFLSPPSGAIIFHRGHTGQTQQTDYDQFTGLPFTAVGHEAALDKITILVQELQEQLSRLPVALEVAIPSANRNRFLPTPVPLKLWGWDALGLNVVYYDPAIVQVTPSLTAHMAFGETQVVVPTVSGAAQLTSGTVFPAGCIRLAALVRVTTTFGNSLGLTTFSAGDPTVMERWGTGLARTTTAAPTGANNPGAFLQYELRPIPSNEVVVLTADAGTFDATGAALITGVYCTFTSA